MDKLTLVKKLFGDILKAPYFRNHAATSGAAHAPSKHEEAIEADFKRNGLTPWDKKLPKKQVWAWIDRPSEAEEMPSMSYISQPCGTHDNPDFLVKLAPGVVLGIESKSSDATHPQYNSGGITPNYIYIFTSSKTNSTTIYLGRDLITVEAQKLIDAHIAEARRRDEALMVKLAAIDVRHRGVTYYTRPMIIQSGDASYTNYFTHAEREQCEKNVFKFVEDMIQGA
jgi:hypothetical protein